MTEPEHTKQIPPKLNRMAVLLASGLAGMCALGGAGVAVFGLPQILWATAGFMIVSLISAALGVIVGAGRIPSGFGMSTLCIGGCIAVSTGFAWIDLRPNLGDAPRLAQMLTPWVFANVLVSGVIVVSGALAVLSRRRASWAAVLKSLVFLVPALVALGGWVLFLPKLPDGDNGRVLALALLLFGGPVVGLLVSLGGHHLIRAFELAADQPTSA